MLKFKNLQKLKDKLRLRGLHGEWQTHTYRAKGTEWTKHVLYLETAVISWWESTKTVCVQELSGGNAEAIKQIVRELCQKERRRRR